MPVNLSEKIEEELRKLSQNLNLPREKRIGMELADSMTATCIERIYTNSEIERIYTNSEAFKVLNNTLKEYLKKEVLAGLEEGEVKNYLRERDKLIEKLLKECY